MFEAANTTHAKNRLIKRSSTGKILTISYFKAFGCKACLDTRPTKKIPRSRRQTKNLARER